MHLKKHKNAKKVDNDSDIPAVVMVTGSYWWLTHIQVDWLVLKEISYHIYIYTVKPLNLGHPCDRQILVFIDKWSLFWGFFVLFIQWNDNRVWPLPTGWSVLGGGLKCKFDCIYILHCLPE